MAPLAEITRHSLTLRPDLGEVARARTYLADIARGAGFSDERRFDIGVAASEACANAIEHSRGGSDVVVDVAVFADRLEVEIEGHGEFELPDAAAERRHRGLGLPLMAKLSDHLALYSGTRGTRVSLTFYRPGFRDRRDDQVTPPSISDLAEESDFISAVTDAAPVGLYVLDPELRFIWVNHAYRQFLEEPYRSQPLEGVFIGEAVPGSAESGAVELIRGVSLSGEPLYFPEYEYAGFTRGATYWRWEILPLKRGRQEPPFDVLVVISEITEQVVQRRSVEQLAAQLRAVLDSMTEGVVIADADANVISMNAEALRLHGMTNEEQAQRNLRDFPEFEVLDLAGQPLRPDDYPLGRVTRGETFTSQEYRVRNRQTGHDSIWSFGGSPVRDESGRLALTVMTIADVTEREQAEARLRENEEELSAYFDSAEMMRGIVEVVDDTTVLHVRDNRVTAGFLGMTPEAMQNKLSTELDEPPEVIRTWVDHYRESQRIGRPVTFEYQESRGDGEAWLAVTVSYLRMGPSGRAQFAYVVQDATARKRAEEAAGEGERRLQSVLENMSEGLMLFDSAQNLIYQNPASLRIHGFGEEEDGRMESAALPATWEAWDKDERPITFTEWPVSRVFRGERFHGQVLHVRRVETGQEFYGSYNGAPIYSSTGKLVLGFITIHDITDVRRAEEEVRRSLAAAQEEREWLSRLVNSMVDEVWFADNERRLTLANPSVVREFGIATDDRRQIEEVASQFEVYRGDMTPRAPSEAPPLRALAGEVVRDEEEIVRTPRTGELRHRLVNAAPVRDANGAIVGSVSVVRDVTEQRLAEAERERYLAEERQLNQELALANEELASVNEELHTQTEELAAQQEALRTSNERQEEQIRLGRALLAISHYLHTSLEPDQMMNEAIALGANALGAETAALDTWEGDGFRIKYTHGWPPDLVGQFVPASLDTHGTLALGTGATLAIDDTSRDPRVKRELMEQYGIKSVLVAPCYLRGERLGALYFNFISGYHHFSEAETTFAGQLASSLSLALENASLYEHQRSLLDRLQRPFLRMPESVEGVDFSAEYRSATSGAQIGGDFYDLYLTPSGRLAVAIGDVSGHGLEAARFATMVKDSFSLQLLEGEQPANVLTRTNRFLIERGVPGFVTAFLALLDKDTGEVIYATAGHPGPLVASGNSDVHALAVAGSAPLAVFADTQYEERRVRLHRGEVVLLYTDGVTEARADGRFYEEERLAASLAQYGRLPVARLVRDVMADVLAFAHGSLVDDAALLAVRFVGEATGNAE